jgi:hypothetical protein
MASPVISTPWGNFMAGPRIGAVPAWVAARDAAAHALQAITESSDEATGKAVRAWQRDRLAQALGISGD